MTPAGIGRAAATTGRTRARTGHIATGVTASGLAAIGIADRDR